eukprot:13508797-Heterocapsa_arctica.AAC.1
MDRPQKLELAVMLDGGSGPQMITFQMNVVFFWERSKDLIRRRSELWLLPLNKSEDVIEVIIDNQYVRDTAQYLAAGGL